MYCINCSNKLSDSARFCNKCGAPVEQPQQPVSNPPQQYTQGYTANAPPQQYTQGYTANAPPQQYIQGYTTNAPPQQYTQGYTTNAPPQQYTQGYTANTPPPREIIPVQNPGYPQVGIRRGNTDSFALALVYIIPILMLITLLSAFPGGFHFGNLLHFYEVIFQVFHVYFVGVFVGLIEILFCIGMLICTYNIYVKSENKKKYKTWLWIFVLVRPLVIFYLVPGILTAFQIARYHGLGWQAFAHLFTRGLHWYTHMLGSHVASVLLSLPTAFSLVFIIYSIDWFRRGSNSMRILSASIFACAALLSTQDFLHGYHGRYTRGSVFHLTNVQIYNGVVDQPIYVYVLNILVYALCALFIWRLCKPVAQQPTPDR